MNPKLTLALPVFFLLNSNLVEQLEHTIYSEWMPLTNNVFQRFHKKRKEMKWNDDLLKRLVLCIPIPMARNEKYSFYIWIISKMFCVQKTWISLQLEASSKTVWFQSLQQFMFPKFSSDHVLCVFSHGVSLRLNLIDNFPNTCALCDWIGNKIVSTSKWAECLWCVCVCCFSENCSIHLNQIWNGYC